jgi:hypothetical protein
MRVRVSLDFDILIESFISLCIIKWVKSLTYLRNAKSLQKKLFAFYSKEKATKKPIVTFDRVYQKTSKALGVSYTSVHRIMNGKRPCKSNRPKERAKILDDFNRIKIQNFM